MGEIPHLRAAVSRLREEGKPLTILAVSLDDTRMSLEMTLRTMDPPGIHTWDEAGRDNPVADMYNARALPVWYLIDQRGIIRARDPFGDKLVPAVRAVYESQPEPGA